MLTLALVSPGDVQTTVTSVSSFGVLCQLYVITEPDKNTEAQRGSGILNPLLVKNPQLVSDRLGGMARARMSA
jgi:hypothetical protein